MAKTYDPWSKWEQPDGTTTDYLARLASYLASRNITNITAPDPTVKSKPWLIETPAPTPPPATEQMEPSDTGSGVGTGPGKGTGMSGPMNDTEKAAVALLGAAMPIGFFGVKPTSVMSLASAIADYFGVVRETNPMLGMSPTDVQATRDMFGNFMGDEHAAAAARAAENERQNTFDALQEGHDPSKSSSPTAGDVTSTPSVGPGALGGPSSGAPEGGWGSLGGLGPSGGMNGPSGGGQGPGGSEGADTDSGGHGAAGDGSMNARGGVQRATEATRAIFGEAGPETAVFVPDMMKKPGLQGQEEEVVSALRGLLKTLSPPKGR